MSDTSCSMPELGRQLARMHLAEPAVKSVTWRRKGMRDVVHVKHDCSISEVGRQLARMHLAEPAVRR
jgi:hypothetical protein